MLIDWCCKLRARTSQQLAQVATRVEGARVGGGRRRVGIGRKWADWLGTLFEGGRGQEEQEEELGASHRLGGWAVLGLGLATGDFWAS